MQNKSTPHPGKEADVLRDCKILLDHLKEAGKLDYWRINTGAKIRAGGFTKNTDMIGFSDLLIIFKNGKVLFAELKKPGGTLSASQVKFKDRVKAVNHRYEVFESVFEMSDLVNRMLTD